MSHVFIRLLARLRRRDHIRPALRGRVTHRVVLAEFGQGDARRRLVALTYANGKNRVTRTR